MKRLIGSANGFYNISKRTNLSISYSNFSASTVYSAYTTLDSLNYVQVTQNAGVSFRHALSNDQKSSVYLQGNVQRLTDPNSVNSNFYNFSSGYQTKFNEIFSGNSAVNYTNNTSGDLIANSVGPSLSVAAQKRKKFKTNIATVWLYAYTNGKISNKYKTYSLHYNHPVGQHQHVSARLSLLDRKRISEQNSHIHELRIEINYGYRF